MDLGEEVEGDWEERGQENYSQDIIYETRIFLKEKNTQDPGFDSQH